MAIRLSPKAVMSPEEEFGVGWPSERYSYSAGAVGGLLGSLAMVVVALAYGVLSGSGIWFPVNLIGAAIVPSLQAAGPAELAQFHLVGLIAGLSVHLTLSVLLGLVYALVLPTLPGRPEMWAVIVGPLLWFAAMFTILPVINPAMQQYVDVTSFALAHVAYSLILGLWVSRSSKVPVHA